MASADYWRGFLSTAAARVSFRFAPYSPTMPNWNVLPAALKARYFLGLRIKHAGDAHAKFQSWIAVTQSDWPKQ
jgi:hypothetical protein